MKTILALLLIITTNYATADGLYTGAWSYHFNREDWRNDGYTLNENNQLLAYQYDKYILGHFYNSFGDSSVLLNVEVASYQFHDFKATLYGGAVYGYMFCEYERSRVGEKKICPNFLPVLKYTRYSIQPTILPLRRGLALSIYWAID